jgi:hypothetical protein
MAYDEIGMRVAWLLHLRMDRCRRFTRLRCHHTSLCTQISPAFTEVAETLFSILLSGTVSLYIPTVNSRCFVPMWIEVSAAAQRLPASIAAIARQSEELEFV